MYCIVYQNGEKLNEFECDTLAGVFEELARSSFTWTYAGSLGNEVKFTANTPNMAAYIRPNRDPNSITPGWEE